MKKISVPKSILRNILNASHSSANDLSRVFITGVNITPEYVEATNGFSLVNIAHDEKIDIDSDLNVEIGITKKSEIKRFLKQTKLSFIHMMIDEDFISFSETDNFNMAKSVNLSLIKKEFLNTGAIKNISSEGTVKFGINVEWLNRISKGLTEGRNEGCLIIEVRTNPAEGVKPVKITSSMNIGKSFGIAMPLKV